MNTSDRNKKLDLVFGALADTTRRSILELIATRSMRVTEVAEHFDMSLNAVSKHLMVLERAGFLNRTKEGRIFHCRMDPRPLEDVQGVVAFYTKFWQQQLDGLEAYLQSTLGRNEDKGEKTE